jgi:biotin transport system ATP-binding protein
MTGQGAVSQGIALTGAEVSVLGKQLLGPVTLNISEHRVGIIGRNGSGKSTLLRLMAGLVAPSAGQVRVDGIDPSGDRKGLIARLGILFQNPDHQIIFPIVEEELAFGLRQMGLGKAETLAQAKARLVAEGRGHWAGRPVSSLSQGQRQYLCLLAVLMMEPATLLLDEPFSGLDIPTARGLAAHLAGLSQRLLVVTHDPLVVQAYDRVIWLEDGLVKGDGTPDAVLPAYLTAMEVADAGPDFGA